MFTNRFKILLISIICFMLISACAFPPSRRGVYPPAVSLPPKVIAVLPFTNQSNDLDAPEILRNIFNRHLSMREGYVLKSLGETDKVLASKGISDAGQLPVISVQELGESLNVDGVIYGELIDFSYITLGVYMKRAVKASFKLINTKTGDLIWEEEKKVSHTELAFKDAGKAFAKQLKDKLKEKVVSSPLRQETEKLVRKVLRTFPPNNW